MNALHPAVRLFITASFDLRREREQSGIPCPTCGAKHAEAELRSYDPKRRHCQRPWFSPRNAMLRSA